MKWDKYYMNIAMSVAMKSKDPSTQVGTVIVNKDNRIIGTGFNGFPSGMKEPKELWNSLDKHKFVIHSETNALLYSVKTTKNATLYTTMFPCQECSKLIAAAGIIRVVYQDSKYDNEVTREVFKRCKIKLQQIG